MLKLHFVTLGCAKNRVDTEWLVALLRDVGELVDAPEKADVWLVNTCAFIEDAREESVDLLLELGAKKRPDQRLVALGCLPQRYGDDLAASLPEVDLFVGTSRLGDLPRLLAEAAKGPHAVPGRLHMEPGRLHMEPGRLYMEPGAVSWLPDAPLARVTTQVGPAAYLKVAEGCDRRCAYCAVPLIRGNKRSLPLSHLVEEARLLVEGGARELNLIAQDLSSWGRDLSPPARLIDLVRELSSLPGLSWIRLLYLYPTAVLEPDFAELFTVPRVVPYVDLPLQHVSTPVLEAMGRSYDGPTARELVRLVQKLPQHVHLRTTFLVGHPGEGDAEFAELEAFVKETGFHHLGVFAYSPEEGTRAFGQPCVEREVALNRRDRLMALQQKISARLVKKLKGRTLQILVEHFDRESWIWTGRHAGQAPEVDGAVILTNCDCRAGDFIPVRIVDTDAYDLVGTP